MDENISEEQLAEKEPDKVLVDDNKRPKIIIIIGSILIILGFIAYFYFNRSDPFVRQSSKASKAQIFVSPTQMKPLDYVTKDTIIAKSLDVPPLYPGVKWSELFDINQDEELSTLADYDNNIRFSPLKGHYWSGTLENDTDTKVMKYYIDAFVKNGWFGTGGVGGLRYKNFRLYPPAAGASCVSENGVDAYKDGKVRLVTIKYMTKPCLTYTTSPIPSNQIIQTEYTIFISDPTPLQYFIDYLNTFKQNNK